MSESIMDLSKASWRKSSRSGGDGQNCVEVAGLSGHVAIRDSKDPCGLPHVVPVRVFGALISRIKRDDLDL
jgi:uncharacterized protein DUF397